MQYMASKKETNSLYRVSTMRRLPMTNVTLIRRIAMLSMTARMKSINTIMQGVVRVSRKAETGEFRVTDMRMRTAYKDEGVYFTDNLDDAVDTAKAIASRYTVC